jgi:TRAP-type mannitol/chloroaromatic compound transport system permease large subunit
VGALLAATTGIVGATVVAMGLISLPAMMRNNYSHSLATGTIAASGTLGQIIPPSIVLIILADQLSGATDQASTARKALFKENTGELIMPSQFDLSSTSAGEMFLGAILPGLLLVALYMIFIAVIAFLRPKVAPTVPYDGKYDVQFWGGVFIALVPPLVLIFAVLGSIILGIATVNQAGAIGAAGALIMAGYRLREGHYRTYWPAILSVISLIAIIVVAWVNPVNIKNVSTSADQTALISACIAVTGLLISLIWSGWRAYKINDTLRAVMVETAKTTSLVFIILIGAAMLTAAFRAFGGEELVKDFLTGLPGGFWGQFFVVMAVIFILGFFLDFIEIAVVVVPIVAPILLADPGANVSAVWLGVMIGLNIQTSFLTPPFGFALFYLRGVAPAAVKTISMYKGVIAFIMLQLLALVIVAYNPPLVNYLPTRLSLTSETAPPPINPKLQGCIESELFPIYRAREQEIRSAIATVRGLDLSILPDKLEKDLTASLDKAEKSFDLIADIKMADDVIAANEDAYKPLHVEVRYLQSQIKDIQVTNRELQTNIRRTRDEAAKAKLEATLAANQAEIQAIQARIPQQWEAEHKAFSDLLKADTTARNLYRRNSDQAYQPVRDTLDVLRATDDLAAAEPELRELKGFVEANPFEAGAEKVRALYNRLRPIDGSRPVQSELSDARRALRGSSPDKAAALAAIDRAIQKFEEEMTWRRQASSSIRPALARYEETIRNTIGLRQQRRIPDDLAILVAGCLSEHQDVSLYF